MQHLSLTHGSEGSYAHAQAEARQGVKAWLPSFGSKKKKAVQQQQQQQQQLTSLQQQEQQLQKQLQGLRQHNDELHEQSHESQQENERLQAQWRQLQEQHKKQSEELQQHVGQIQTLQTSNDLLTAQHRLAEQKVVDAQVSARQQIAMLREQAASQVCQPHHDRLLCCLASAMTFMSHGRSVCSHTCHQHAQHMVLQSVKPSLLCICRDFLLISLVQLVMY